MRTRILQLMTEKQAKEGTRVITPAVVANATGLTRATIMKWIKDDLDRLEDPTIVALCRYFNCDIQDLIYLDMDAPDKTPISQRGREKRRKIE